ncbi:MAG TPA: aldo/keto reductase [Polyangiaceae bacterium]|nr:aldo/keto reductase [Polyangiaceae bacterium]
METSSGEFLSRQLRHVGKRVHRLGLACNYGIDARGFRAALDAGMNYFFWTPFRTGQVTPLLKAELARERERYVVATGPMTGYFGGSVRSAAEKHLRMLGTDYLDVFQLCWLGVGSALTGGTLGELEALKREGKVRSIGVSIHNRVRAGKLAEDSPLDLFMIRYNAAHPGAERDIFPHLAKRRPDVVSYTATSWRKLLKRPKGWDGPVMTPGDCYRFCLSSPHVDVALTGPASKEQLLENLEGVTKGALSAEEDAWMRRFGEAVHG